jgi:hypothetical protein
MGKHLPEVVPDAAGRPLFSFRGNHRLRPGHYCSRKAGKSGNMPFFQLLSFRGFGRVSGGSPRVQRLPASRLAQYRVDQVQRRGGQVVPHELGNVFCADMYFVYQLTFEGYRAIVATASAAQIGHLLVKCLAD